MIRRSSSLFGASVLMLALAWLCVGVGTASAQVPYDMSYQGRLTDAVGAPLIGPVNLQMRIYDVISGGTALYVEDHTNVSVDDVGAFSVRLGAGSTILGTFNTALFAGVNRYLEVVVDGSALTPRLIIGSVPYAMHADNAASGQAAADAAQTTADAAQVRVIGSCPADSSIRSIGADGSVTCEADDDHDTTLDEAAVVAIVASNGFSTGAHTVNTDTTYTAGSGITLTGSTFSANTAVVQARVTGNCAVGEAITAIASDGTVTCAAFDSSPAVRFIDCGDGSVEDTQIGLVWELKTSAGIHFRFANYHILPFNNNWESVYVAFIDELNNPSATGGCFTGHCDWRLPTVAELVTILPSPLSAHPSHQNACYGYPAEGCVASGFPDTEVSAGAYWTSDIDPTGGYTSLMRVALTTPGSTYTWTTFSGDINFTAGARAVRTGSCDP